MASEDGEDEVPFTANFSIAEILEMPQKQLKHIADISHENIKTLLEPVSAQFQVGIKSADFRIACFNQKADSINKSHARAISQLEKQIEDLQATNKSQRRIIRKLERALQYQNTASSSQHNVIKDLLSSAKEKEAAFEEVSERARSSCSNSMSKYQSPKNRSSESSDDEIEEFVSSIQGLVDVLASKLPSDPSLFDHLFDFLSFMPDIMAMLDIDPVSCARRRHQLSSSQ